MGFAVKCSGADLLGSLRKNEDKVLGRRFPLYMFTLATEIDDNIIKWLSEYGRAIDSLTGDNIAFFVFFNSAKFKASTNVSSGVVDSVGTKEVFRTIPVPKGALQSAISLREFVAGTMKFPNDAFVSTMTYESDNMARYLNISPADLPCLVLFDDPQSGDFYTIPINYTNKELIALLRDFVGRFYNNEKFTEYFRLISEWDTLDAKLSNLEYEKIDLKSIIARFEHNLARRELIRLLGTLPSPQSIHLTKSLDKNGLVRRFMYCDIMLRRWKRITKEFQMLQTNEAFRNEFHFPRFYRRCIRPFVPPQQRLAWEEVNDFSPSRWMTFIGDLVYDRCDTEIRLQSDLSILQSEVDEYIAQIDLQTKSYGEKIDEIKKKLSDIPRPSIASILKDIKWDKNKSVLGSIIKRTAQFVGRNVESIIDVARIGIGS